MVLLVLGFFVAASVFTDILWFDQLGYLSVLTTQWIAAAIMFVIGFVAMALPVFFAIDIAYRTRPVYARLNAQLDRYQELLEPLRNLVKWSVPAVFGVFAGLAASANWQRALLWLNATEGDATDPEFGLNISFYMFTLPMLQAIVSFASAVVLISLLLGVATSYLYGGISLVGRDVRVSKSTRIQAAVLAFIYLLLQGVSLWLDRYATLTSNGGLFTGATYTDANAVIPGKQILAGAAVLVAVLFLITAFTGKWRLPVIGTALLLVSALVVGVAYPWGIQELRVQPDEKNLESEYLARNISATRQAYGIDQVQIERYEATTDAAPGQLRDDAVTTANIRIIDPEVVSPTFAQLQQIRQYYQFPQTLNVDRYTLDGKSEDTVSAVREIDISQQTSWYNRALVYTHGYGLVAAYGNQRSENGEPVFIESGIPTQGRLGSFEPRVYFSPNSPEYSIVGGDRDKKIELDYPFTDETNNAGAAEESAEPGAAGEEAGDTEEAATDNRENLYTFTGDGGPVLSNLFLKIIYALKFQSMEILLSDAVVTNSQVLYDRDPVSRVQKVAPYLTIDSSPYASVVNGEIVWVIDGYTTSNQYPYSQQRDFNDLTEDADNPRTDPLSQQVNYVRNSVKATVNAYDGSVTLYAWDETDPILQSWSKVFPGTLKPVSEMSGDLLSHVRYPSDLFKAQREMLATYHVTDPGAFYSDEDAWRTPEDPVSTATAPTGEALRQPPYYLTLAAGADADPNFSIYSTYIPAARGEDARNILTGYLAANANAGNTDGKIAKEYGTLKLLKIPTGNAVPGPGQVQNSFSTDAEVSRLLNILRSGGSEVISGNLLTLPVGGGFLYVQPVYVQASSGTSFPILQKILVSFGERIAFEDTLDGALDALFGGNSGAPTGDQSAGAVTPPVTTPTDGETTASTGNAELEQALRDMQQAIADRDAARKAGDWAAYGEADQRLTDALERAINAQ